MTTGAASHKLRSSLWDFISSKLKSQQARSPTAHQPQCLRRTLSHNLKNARNTFIPKQMATMGRQLLSHISSVGLAIPRRGYNRNMVMSRGFASGVVAFGTIPPPSVSEAAAAAVSRSTTDSSILRRIDCKRIWSIARCKQRSHTTQQVRHASTFPPKKDNRRPGNGNGNTKAAKHNQNHNQNQNQRKPQPENVHAAIAASVHPVFPSIAPPPEPFHYAALPPPRTGPPIPVGTDSRGSWYRSAIANLHRPTRDEMLAAANGFFERLRIRTKWTLIRQMRPYTFDEITAFLSWLFVGHLLWFLLGTTTFFSIVVLLVNTVMAQEFLAGVIGNYLTKQTGIQVVFESAIVPRWKDGCITLSNVFVSRRPGNKKKASVRKGSSVTAAAAAAAALKAEEEEHARASHHEEPEDQNYTQFDVTFDTVNVTLSFARWMNGKGLLQDVEIKGVRGVLDRTHVVWDESIDPRSYKHVHEPGDFEIERFKIEDLLLTVYQPDGFRPFPVSIFSMELPQFRKQWLFYDLINANHMSGSYDNSLFTIHPKQTHGLSQAQELDDNEFPWKKMSRLRIDGLNIEHLNHGVEGPFSWIASGTVDISADLLVPTDDDSAFTQLFQQIVSSVEQTVNNTRIPLGSLGSFRTSILNTPSEEAPLAETPENNDTDTLIEPPVEKFVVLDLHCKLNDVKAAVPVFTSDLSYVNNALIRPIVAYINTRRTYIPINCRVIKRLSEFDGSWTIFDSGLMDDLSAETYEAFVRNVADEDVRRRRMRKVGLWSLQMIAQLLALAMAGNLA